MEKEIRREIANPFLKPFGRGHVFSVYVLGTDNQRRLQKMGISSIVVDKRPMLFDRNNLYRNRMALWAAAMQDFDRVVFLDWDCFPTCRIPANFWELLESKSEIQSPLTAYKYPRCSWRGASSDARLLPNGGWVYVRNRSIPKGILDHWNRFEGEALGEKVIAHWMDKQYGWRGREDYYQRFEPFCISLPKTVPIYGKMPLEGKCNIFEHCHI